MKPLHVFRDMSQGIHAHVTKTFSESGIAPVPKESMTIVKIRLYFDI